jgi:hypothetical protein
MKWAAVGVLTGLLLGAIPALAQEVNEDLPASDARLNQKFLVQAEGIALGDLLARMTKESGISLRADRETMDDKVILFGPARPLRETLADFATLFGHRWMHAKEEGQERYILVKRAAVRERENELTNAATRQLQAQLDAQARALSEPPERLAKRDKEDPIRRFLSDPESRLATQLYARLDSRQKETLFSQSRLRLAHASLSPEVKRALLASLESVQRRIDRVLNPSGDLPDSRQQTSSDAGPNQFAAVARSTPPDLEFQLDLRQNGFLQARMSPPALTLFAELKAKPISLPLQCNPYTGQQLPPNAVLPAEKAIPERGQEEWVRKLQRLSEAANVPVMADYYRLRGVPPVEKASLLGSGTYGALTVFCAWDGYLWWTRGNTLLFRKRDWYLRRQYEVPDRWLTQASKALQEREGRPTYADVQRLADLTPKQLIGLMNLDKERSGILPDIFDTDSERAASLPEILQILKEKALPRGSSNTPLPNYETLSQEDWNRAIKETTLAYPEMVFAQRRLIPAFLAAQSKQVAGVEPENFAFYLRTFNLTSGPQNLSYVWAEIHWESKGVQGDYRLPLPLTLPDDRRAATVVARSD